MTPNFFLIPGIVITQRTDTEKKTAIFLVGLELGRATLSFFDKHSGQKSDFSFIGISFTGINKLRCPPTKTVLNTRGTGRAE